MELRNDLSDDSDVTKGDSLIGFRQLAVGATGRTVHEKLTEFVSVMDFGARGDVRTARERPVIAGSRELSSATAIFSRSDEGKDICIHQHGAEFFSTTIASVVSNTEVRLANAPPTDMSDANVSWGTDDAVAIQAAITSAPSSIFFPPGTYLVGADITFNIAVQFAPGANLKPNNGITVTFNSEILAPKDSIIFDICCGSFKINWTGKVYANWWSGDDIGERWNNMRKSLSPNFKDENEPRNLAIVGWHEVTTTMNWNDIRGTFNPVKIDMTEASLIGKTRDKPVIEMINSRHVIVDGLSMHGQIEDNSTGKSIPNVGIVIGRDKSGDASGEHLFSNFRFRGGYQIAAVYVVDAEIIKWVNGMVVNDSIDGRYDMFIGTKNIDRVSYDKINDGISMKGQFFNNVHWRGSPKDGGLYLYGADNVFIHGSFFKHGHKSIVPCGPHMVLDTSDKTISDCTFTDIFCEAQGKTSPPIGCHLKGASRVKNCVFEFKDFGSYQYILTPGEKPACGPQTKVSTSTERITGPGFQVDVPTEYCKFRQAAGNDFIVSVTVDMLYCDIDTNPNTPTNVILGKKFSGFIRMANPSIKLSPPSEEFFASVCDLENGLVNHHRTTGHRDTMSLVSDTDPVTFDMARSLGNPGAETALQDKDVIGEYRFLARRSGGRLSEVCKINGVYRGDGSDRVGDIQIVAENRGKEHVAGRAHHDGYFILEAQDGPLTDSELNKSEMTFYLDELSDQLVIMVKYKDGTVKTGRMPLT